MPPVSRRASLSLVAAGDGAAAGPFEVAFDAAPSGLALLDDDGVVLRANPALAVVLARDAAVRLEGIVLAEHEAFSSTAANALSKVAHELVHGDAPARRIELRLNGETADRWLQVTMTPLRQPDPGSAQVLLQAVEVTEQHLAQRDLDDRSKRDPLTGLGNRLLLFQWLDRATETGAGQQTSVLFIDLDRFKWTNDTLGHNAGDAVLVAVAQRLRRLVRPSDLVTRVGGDEFVVVLHDVAAQPAAVEVAERVVLALREPVVVDGHELVVCGSVGVSTPGSGARDSHTMLADADTAMYRAKQAGGNRVVVFSPPMRRARERHMQTDTALRAALRADSLQLSYQPIVDLRDGQFAGVEALLRWPGHDEIQDVIAVAEESDLIALLGEWVLARAVTDAPAATIGVNVSVRQLMRPHFVHVVRRTLAAAGVAPDRLCIEVTETSLADNVETVVETLNDLRELGARVAIDDFGTGHASLTYLAKFPVDIVKVDRSFVRGLGSDPACGVIVRSVAAMAHALGMSVIAEGVESLQQLELVLQAGCDAAQGYLFSRPEPRQRCVETLANAVPWPVGFSKRRPRATSMTLSPVVEPARRYRMLLDLARDITGRLDVDEVLASTLAALRQLLMFGGGSIQLLDASGEYVRLAAADPAPSLAATQARIPVGQGVAGRIVASGEPRYIPDILKDPDVPVLRATSDGVRSYFGVPLITEGAVIGVMQIDSGEVDAFSEEDRFTVLAFTPIVAAAIQTARLFEREAAQALTPQPRPPTDDTLFEGPRDDG